LASVGGASVAVDKAGSIDNVEPLLGHPRFEFQHYDVTHFLYVEGELDAILHFASPASPADFERRGI